MITLLDTCCLPPLHSHVPLAGCLPGFQLYHCPHGHSETPPSELSAAWAPPPWRPGPPQVLLSLQLLERWQAYWLCVRQDITK